MALWAILALTAAGLFVFFLLIPALLVFFAVFGKKKAIPFEQYDLKKFSSHYYIPYLGRIADARQKLQAYAHTGVTMTTADGLRMYGEFYDQGSTRTAILFHGINAEMYTNMSAQALFLYESGFNVLMTCQRAHGKSEGRFTTIGLRERYDVLDWVRFAEQNGAKDLLLYGVSMGAAGVAYASPLLGGTRVRAMVIESGFYSIYEQMRRDAYKNHIPKIMLPAQWVLAKLLLRVNIKEATADALAQTGTPAFFLHGKADETVEYRWAQTNCKACASPKRLLLAENAPHTLCMLEQPEIVKRELKGFFEQYFN